MAPTVSIARQWAARLGHFLRRSPTVGRPWLSARLVAILAVLRVPASGGAALLTSFQEDQSGAFDGLLDLPAMVIEPAGLPDDGYGVAISVARGPAAYAAFLKSVAGGRSADAAALDEELDETGWRQAYRIILSLPSDEDPDLFGRSVSGPPR
jgi:hypothetical protein